MSNKSLTNQLFPWLILIWQYMLPKQCQRLVYYTNFLQVDTRIAIHAHRTMSVLGQLNAAIVWEDA